MTGTENMLIVGNYENGFREEAKTDKQKKH